MKLGVTLAISGAVIAGVAAVSGAPAGAAAKPPPRYASPHGTASITCSRLAPCDLVTAVNQAPAHSEVIIEPGTYDKATPLTTTLQDISTGLYIHGEAGRAQPTIYSATSSNDPAIQIDGSRLSDITVVSTAFFGLLVNGGSADHVDSEDTGNDGTACEIATRLSDSLCEATGSSSAGVFEVKAGTVHLTGVTAVATGSGGAGLSVFADTSPLTVDATDSIFQGSGSDIVTQDFANDQTETVNVTHSDYVTYVDQPSAGSTNTLTPSSTNVRTAPVFVDAAMNDYRELPRSPTVNRGQRDEPAADLDLAGNPRVVGPAPDMGAYELIVAPVLGKLTVTKTKSPGTVKLTLPVNPAGLPTTLRAVARHGRTTVKSAAVTTRSYSRAVAHLTLAHLKKHTKYSVYVVVSNAAGLLPSQTRHFTTRKK